MAYELAYISKNGTHSYFSKNYGFTRKAANHWQWQTAALLKAELPALKQKHITSFNTRKPRQFYILDTETKQLERLTLPAETPAIDKVSSLAFGSSQYYAVAIDSDKERLFLNTKEGKLTARLNESVRLWDDLQKAQATASSLRLNKRFWLNYHELDPQATYVFNLVTNQRVWPAKAGKDGDDSKEVLNTVALEIQLRQLRDQLKPRFSLENCQLPSKEKLHERPADVDLEKYNAGRVFAALSYLLEALTQKNKTDKLLNYYDKFITQDFLHVAEAADPENLDNAAFVKQLHDSRVRRRQIKDLDLFLNAIADNLNIWELLKQLGNNASLHNQYYYRDRETAGQMEAALADQRRLDGFTQARQ